MRAFCISLIFLVCCNSNDLKNKETLAFELNERAISYFKEEQLDSALFCINKALELDTSFADLYLTKGDIYLYNNLAPFSRDMWEYCIKLSPKNIDCRLRLAYLYRIAGINPNYEKSNQYLEEVLALDINNEYAFYYKGLNEIDQGNTQQGIRYMQYAIENGYEKINVYLSLGSALEKIDSDLSFEYYKMALNIDSANWKAHHNIGIYFENQDEYNKAIESYIKSTECNTFSTESFHRLGHIYIQLQVYDFAKKYFLKAIEIDSSHYQSHYALGYSLEMLGDVVNAAYHYKKTMEISPEYLDTSKYLSPSSRIRLLEEQNY